MSFFRRSKPAPPPSFSAPRLAREEDAPLILETHRAALDELIRTDYAGTQLGEWAERLSERDYLSAIAENHFLVVEAGDGLAGFADFDAKEGELIALYVHPNHARRGVGTLILRAVEERAGGASISLLAALPAVRFYERFGYVAEEPILHDLGQGIAIRCVPMSRKEA